jgi:hypothetical protein
MFRTFQVRTLFRRDAFFVVLQPIYVSQLRVYGKSLHQKRFP